MSSAEDDGILLNVAAVQTKSLVNGPGTRSVAWVQGCTIRCEGCINPKLLAHREAYLIDPRQMARDLAKEDTDGLTISGGEPFEQAQACSILASEYREISGRSVLVFTGFDQRALRRQAATVELLDSCDILISGRYEKSLEAEEATCWNSQPWKEVMGQTRRGIEEIQDARSSASLETIVPKVSLPVFRTGFMAMPLREFVW